MKPQSGAQVVDAGFSLDGNKIFSEKKHNGRQGCIFFFLFLIHQQARETRGVAQKIGEGRFCTFKPMCDT